MIILKNQKTGKLFYIALILLTSCASWDLKDRCEKTNWFEYSKNIAFTGKYLEEDSFVKECRGVDRIQNDQLDRGFKLGREKMCNYGEIYQRGKDGEPVFFQFCDGLEAIKMKKSYNDGLIVFCTSEVGYTYGKSGKIYQKVCSPDKENIFIPSYNKGRREFLTSENQRLTQKISELTVEKSKLETREYQVSREYSNLPNNLKTCTTKTVYNSQTKLNESHQNCEEPSYIVSQRNELSSSLNNIRSNIRNFESDIKKSRQDFDNNQLELSKLPN